MKRIIVSQRVDTIESYLEQRDALDQRWAEFLWEAGYLGIPVPNHMLTLAEIIKSIPIDGILLTGGNTPEAYGGNAPERDASDKFLISYAANSGKPLLGVCRGMQSILLYFGGSLRKVEGHIALRHTIVPESGDSRFVNSYHEYAPNTLPDAFLPGAYTMDKVVEHIFHKTLPITGIMWHPEREKPFVKEDVNLVRAVFK